MTYWVTPDADLAQRLGQVGDFLGLEDYELELPHRYGMYRGQWRKNWRTALLGSHVPISGTAVRAVLLMWPIIAVALILGADARIVLTTGFWVYVGMAYSDAWHILSDRVVSDVKRGWK